MVATNGLLRIFWPSDALKNKSQGILVGWRNSPLDILVVSVLHDVEVLDMQGPSIGQSANLPQGAKSGGCSSHRHFVPR